MWKTLGVIVLVVLLSVVLFSGYLVFLKKGDTVATEPPIDPGEVGVLETAEIAVETFQLLPSGALDLFPGIPVLVSQDGVNYTKVGETSVQTIGGEDGIPSPVWFGTVNVGDWITIDPPDNCIFWEAGIYSWVKAYQVVQTEPLKFQLVCGENIPSPTPTNPPAGPTDTPFVPTNTPRPTDTPDEPTNTPRPPTETPEPTEEVGCNCPTPEKTLPPIDAPTTWPTTEAGTSTPSR